ncbi:hypothetical protein AB3R30_04625 [Leptolyngbyaceae cyanobacterium UHCC 1019]
MTVLSRAKLHLPSDYPDTESLHNQNLSLLPHPMRKQPTEAGQDNGNGFWYK